MEGRGCGAMETGLQLAGQGLTSASGPPLQDLQRPVLRIEYCLSTNQGVLNPMGKAPRLKLILEL